jgi:hypothetical protein
MYGWSCWGTLTGIADSRSFTEVSRPPGGRVFAVGAAVVAGEKPCVLLISPSLAKWLRRNWQRMREERFTRTTNNRIGRAAAPAPPSPTVRVSVDDCHTFDGTEIFLA